MKRVRNILFEIETLWIKLQHSRRKQPLTWYTSDFHFSHKNALTYCDRPFVSIGSMNEGLIRRWNAMVKPFDYVYFLGDFSMNKNRMKDIVPRLQGYKTIVPGNHDDCFVWNSRPNPKKVFAYTEMGWNILPTISQAWVNRFLVVLSHFPYADEEAAKYDTRYMEYRPVRGNEDFLIHGHLHSKYIKSGNKIDVGIDNNFRLYSSHDILKLMKDKRSFIPSRLTNFYKGRVLDASDN